nr:MAG TPA: antirepressor [Caudoviricetes sp.]
MRLQLVKQGDFLGTKCDFYVNETGDIFMSRTQIGYALKYKNPSKGIEDIHNRHHDRLDTMSVKVDPLSLQGSNPHYRNGERAYMYPEKGIYEICRYSRQKVAGDFYDWVYDVIQSIKKNGYYIASEKDEKWLGIRQETKEVRKAETDQIKLFVEYARAQGSQHADRYYVSLTKLINRRLGIESGGRDKADQRTLMHLKSLETVVELHLATLMVEGLPYKEIYQGVKKFIEAL